MAAIGHESGDHKVTAREQKLLGECNGFQIA